MKKQKHSPTLKKIILTLILAAAGIVAFSAAGTARDDTRKSGSLQGRLSAKFVEVGKVWATTKVVSGVISVLETIQIEITPFGFGTALNPLGWTAVVDNVLDQLSIACLWAMGAITVEKILLSLSFWIALKIIVPLCTFLCIVSLWTSAALKQRIRRVLLSFSIIALTACLAIPVSLGLSFLVEESLLSNEVEKKLEALRSGSGEVSSMLEESGEKEFSIIETVKRISSSIVRFISDQKGVFDARADSSA